MAALIADPGVEERLIAERRAGDGIAKMKFGTESTSSCRTPMSSIKN